MLQLLYQSVEVKEELRLGMKLSVYRSVYTLILGYQHKQK